MEGVIVVLLVIIAVMVFAGPRFGAVRSDRRGYRSGGGSGWLVGLLPFLGSDDRDERDRDGGGDGGSVMNASGSPDDRDQNDRDDDASDGGGDDGGDSDGGDSD
jgi:hypothetical protein